MSARVSPHRIVAAAPYDASVRSEKCAYGECPAVKFAWASAVHRLPEHGMGLIREG